MELLPLPLAVIIASGFIGLLGLTLLLNIFGLPANWIIIGLIAIWKFCVPLSGNLDLLFWILIIGLAIVGEILELFLQVNKAKRYGSSSSGTFAGLIGAIAGAIIFAPLFWGIGALLGALMGAWCGCFLMELLKGRPTEEASRAAFGAMIGRFLGTVCKIGIGAVIIAITAHYIWPEEKELPEQGQLTYYDSPKINLNSYIL